MPDDPLLDDADLAELRAVAESAMRDRCEFTTSAGVSVVGATEIPCGLVASDMRPDEVGLGARTTPVSLMELTIPATHSILTTAPVVLSSYRVNYTRADGRTLKLKVIKYLGPKTNETKARIIVEHVG